MPNPLSLETVCLSKVISNLDKFSPASLALLPVHLRHLLLHNIPAADVCRLEQTSVAKNINIATVWEALCENNIPFKVESSTGLFASKLLTSPDSKPFYFSFISSILLNHIHSAEYTTHTSQVLELLFSIKNCLGIDSWSGICHTHLHPRQQLEVIVPSHYATYFSPNAYQYSDVQLISIILGATHYFPPTLMVVCERFYECIRSEYWSSKHRDVLTNYLSQLKGLSISHNSEDLSSASVPTFIMNVLSATKLQLETLSLVCTHHSFFESAIIGFVSHLYDPECTCELKSLECESLYGAIDDSSCFDLARVIEKHPTLEYVRLEFHSAPNVSVASPGHNLLYQALATLNNQSKSLCISLEKVSISLASLQTIIHSFLTGPCEDKQSLLLDQLSILSSSEVGFVKDLSHFSGSTEAVVYKTLHLGYTDLPPVFLRWLDEHACLRLKSLLLSSEEGFSHNLLPTLLNHSRLEVESLSVHGYVLSPHLKHTRFFNRIFQCVTLKELALCSAELGSNGCLFDLVCGINKQALLGSLMELDISFNELGKAPDTALQLMFEALVSLPQVELFVLEMHSNDFDKRHFNMLQKIWEERGKGKKFRRLSCYDNSQLQPADFEGLRDLAVELECD